MKQPRPISSIKKQSTGSAPFVNDSTLVNDPVALVNDPTALGGAPIAVTPAVSAKVTVRRYYPIIKKRR